MTTFNCSLLLTLLIVLAAFGSPFALAQTEEVEAKDSVDMVDDSELPYFGFGGGYAIAYSFVNSDDLKRIGNDFDISLDGLYLYGGTAYVGFSKVRIAYYSVGGTTEATRTIVIDSVETQQTFSFSRVINAAQVGHPFRITPPSLWFIPEIMVGGSTQNLIIKDRQGEKNIKQLSFFFQPSLTVEYGWGNVIIFRTGLGYAFSYGSNWKDTSGQVVADGPEVNGNFNMQFGVSFDIAGLLILSASGI
ncbi:MAG: hypothetical protein AB7H80_12960 [Candidatus Kapaibacterium sp.]